MKNKTGKILAVLLIVIMAFSMPGMILAQDEFLFKSDDEIHFTEPAKSESQATEEAIEPESDTAQQTVSKGLEEEQEADSEQQQTSNNSISGMLWLDLNDDGIRDADEPAIANYPIYLCESGNTADVIKIAYTDANGDYSFENLTPGKYIVRINSAELGPDKYLLPLIYQVNGNKFKVNTETWLSAGSDPIELGEGTVVKKIDAGMRNPMGIQPLSASDEDSLRAAVSGAEAGDVIALLNDITLTGSPLNIPAGKVITLTGGKTLTGASGQAVIAVSGGLTLADITLTHTAGQTGRGVTVISGGKLTMEAGAAIAGNTASSGGGVYSDGALTMNGGDILGNTADLGSGVYVNSGTFTMNGGEISGNTAGNNGGVYIAANGIFTMKSGNIAGNKANGSSSTSGGGGVYNGGAFTMEGGKISGNTAIRGGVYNSGIFTMKRGEISDNTSTSTTSGGAGVYVAASGTFTMEGGKILVNTAVNGGGGVYSSGIFTMKSGEISGNTATSSTSSGGGIYIAANGTFTMLNGEISGNTAYNGGGVYLSGSNSKFTMEYGEVSGNTAGNSGGGVYAATGSNFTLVDGSVKGNRGNGSSSTSGGGGVYTGASFIMKGGEISSNTAIRGGVYISTNGIFTMEGGKISYNTATSNGGGVYDAGAFTMKGGSISGNNANGSSTTSGGGGLYVATNGASTMEAGEISNNTAVFNGGGVHDSGAFVMKGGSITGNKSSGNGGGIYHNNTQTLDVSGGAIINNTAAGNGGGIYITDITRLTADNMRFSGNKAQRAYYIKPTDIAAHDVRITNLISLSFPFGINDPIYKYAYNNYDINYSGISIYTVTFEANGGTPEPGVQYIVSGSATQPPDMTNKNEKFSGWFLDNETFERPYSFSAPVTEDITLYAKWIQLVPVEYTVTYYYNGILDQSKTYTVSTNYVNDIITSGDYIDKSGSDYEFDSDNCPFTLTSDAESNTIEVRYVAKKDISFAVAYTVEYYYDNVLDTSKTYNGAGEVGDNILTYPDKAKTGYKFEYVDGLPITLDENPENNVIRVYYVKTNVPDIPRTGDSDAWIWAGLILFGIVSFVLALRKRIVIPNCHS